MVMGEDQDLKRRLERLKKQTAANASARTIIGTATTTPPPPPASILRKSNKTTAKMTNSTMKKDNGEGDDDDIFSTISFHSTTAVHRDIDEQPTALIQHLYSKKWKAALDRIREAPEEAEIWVYRSKPENPKEPKKEDNSNKTDKSKTKNTKWQLLPLHAALILDAPHAVVQALVQAAPLSVRAKDDQGSLPVHLSCRMASTPEIMRLLLKAYPQAATKRDGSGQTPQEMLTSSMASTSSGGPNNKQALLHALEKYLESSDNKNGDDTTVTTSSSSVDNDTTPPGSVQDEEGDIAGCESLGELREAKGDDRSTSIQNHSHQSPKTTNVQKAVKNVAPERCALDDVIGGDDSQPVQVAYVDQNQTCSADESSMGPKGTTEIEQAAATTRPPHVEVSSSPQNTSKDQKHYAELAAVTEEIAQQMEKIRAEGEEQLRQKLKELDEKQQREVRLEVAKLHKDDDKSVDFQTQITLLRQQHAKQVASTKSAAAFEQQLASQQVTQKFAQTIMNIQQRFGPSSSSLPTAPTPNHSNVTTGEKTPLLTPESPPTMNQQFETFNAAANNASLVAEKFQQWQGMMENQHQVQLQDLKLQFQVARSEATHEARRALEQQHNKEMKRVKQSFNKKISEVHGVINELHAEMIQAYKTNLSQAKELKSIVEGLDGKVEVMQKDTKAHKKQCEEQFDDFAKQYIDYKEQSESYLEDQIRELEDRLEEQMERGERMERKLEQMQNGWTMLCLG
eukprot:CAMPEP_0168815190 /NCGR_PEP_ID=MMETSP0726-20121227/6074_1 /TAXON_ID=265536 /ORGANISM="Amphiprora sp., Strain CCMP467" /LENGTH=737 /DNA_ID=CAMNT_0008867399 /DNA_START=157 /DNA_END=2370 /DNA_ORIENTATION=-